MHYYIFPQEFGTLSRHSNTIHSLKTSSQGDKSLKQTSTNRHCRQRSAWFALCLHKSIQGIQTCIDRANETVLCTYQKTAPSQAGRSTTNAQTRIP